MNPLSQILCALTIAAGLCDQVTAVYISSAAAVVVEIGLRYATIGDE